MTPAWLPQLISAIFRYWPNGEKLMAVLCEAYVDESQTGEGPSRTYTVSCLVAPSCVWEQFSADWTDALKCCGAEGKIVHMKTLVHGVKGSEWEGWDETRQRPLFEKLMNVTRQYQPLGYCYSLPLKDFGEIMNPADEFEPFEMLLNNAMLSIKNYLRPTKENPVVFFMEQNQMVEASALRQFLHRTEGRGWKDIFLTLVPLPKGPEPLQLADVVAYEGSRFSSEQVFGSSGRKPRKLYEELVSTGTMVFGAADHRCLVDGAKKVVEIQRALLPEKKADIRRTWKAAHKRMQRERDPRFGVKRGGK
jgi:hypothetical protein